MVGQHQHPSLERLVLAARNADLEDGRGDQPADDVQPPVPDSPDEGALSHESFDRPRALLQVAGSHMEASFCPCSIAASPCNRLSQTESRTGRFEVANAEFFPFQIKSVLCLKFKLCQVFFCFLTFLRFQGTPPHFHSNLSAVDPSIRKFIASSYFSLVATLLNRHLAPASRNSVCFPAFLVFAFSFLICLCALFTIIIVFCLHETENINVFGP